MTDKIIEVDPEGRAFPVGIKLEPLSPDEFDLSSTSASPLNCGPPRTDRGSTWTFAEIDYLVDLWISPEIQKKLSQSTHNQHVFEELAQTLRNNGYERTAHQCRIKIKKLRHEYYNYKRRKTAVNIRHRYLHFFNKFNRVVQSLPTNTIPDLSSPSCANATVTSDHASANGLPLHFHLNDAVTTNDNDPFRNPDQPTNSFAFNKFSSHPTVDGGKSNMTVNPRAERMVKKLLEHQRLTEEMFFDFEERRQRQEAEFKRKLMADELDHNARMIEMIIRSVSKGQIQIE